MNIGMKRASGAGSIAQPLDLQSSIPTNVLWLPPPWYKEILLIVILTECWCKLTSMLIDLVLGLCRYLVQYVFSLNPDGPSLCIIIIVSLGAKGRYCVCKWLEVKPFCRSTENILKLYIVIIHAEITITTIVCSILLHSSQYYSV